MMRMEAKAASPGRQQALTVVLVEWYRSVLFYMGVFVVAFYGFLYSEYLIMAIPPAYLEGLPLATVDYLIKILAVFLGVFGFFGTLLDFASNYVLQKGVWEKNASFIQNWWTYQFLLMILAGFAIFLNLFYLAQRGIGFSVTFVMLAIFLIYRRTTFIIIMDYRKEIMEDEWRRNRIQPILVQPDSPSSA